MHAERIRKLGMGLMLLWLLGIHSNAEEPGGKVMVFSRNEPGEIRVKVTRGELPGEIASGLSYNEWLAHVLTHFVPIGESMIPVETNHSAIVGEPGIWHLEVTNEANDRRFVYVINLDSMGNFVALSVTGPKREFPESSTLEPGETLNCFVSMKPDCWEHFFVLSSKSWVPWTEILSEDSTFSTNELAQVLDRYDLRSNDLDAALEAAVEIVTATRAPYVSKRGVYNLLGEIYQPVAREGAGQSASLRVSLAGLTDPVKRRTVMLSLGRAYRAEGKLDQASASFMEALELGKVGQQAEVEAELGKTYLLANRLQEAERHYRAALGLVESPRQRIGLLIDLGALEYNRGRYERSKVALESALELSQV